MPSITISAANLERLCDTALDEISGAEKTEPYEQGIYDSEHGRCKGRADDSGRHMLLSSI